MVSGGSPKAEAKRRKKNEEDEERNKRSESEQHDTAEPLPGITYDVTLYEICQRLLLTDLHTLWSVSRAWREAIGSRRMYDERVRTGSTDKILVINNTLPNGTFGIALYSLPAKAILQLPPIPRVETGIPQSCQCIALDGKIYILGGLKEPKAQVCSEEVFMWDAAGQRSWKKCTSMRTARCNFGSGVIDGKIYVYGGSSCRKPVRQTEVYDPMTDAWTTLAPMPSSRTSHQVGIWGGELLVYDGAFFSPNFAERDCTVPALHIEVYNPIDDQWRRGSEDIVHTPFDRLFMVDGRLHAISRNRIYDREQNGWTCLQKVSRSVAEVLKPYRRHLSPDAILATDGDLFVIETLSDRKPHVFDWLGNTFPNGREGSLTVLNRSIGFGIQKTRVRWQKEVSSLSFEGLDSLVIRTLQL